MTIEKTGYNTASQNMRGFGGFLTFLIIFKLYNGGLERWAENPHVSNAETVSINYMKILYYWKKALFLVLSLVVIITISTLITGNFKFDFHNSDSLIYLILGFSIFLGTFYFIYNKYFAPKIRLEQLEEYPFTEFKRIGFELNKDCLIGKFKKYTVIVGYNRELNDRHQTVYTMILFDPRLDGKNLNDYNLLKFQQSIKDKFNFWNYGSLTTTFPFQFNTPKFRKIILKLEKNIKLIENKGLKKIDFNDWKKEIETHIEINN